MIILDVITGLLFAVFTGTVKSSKMREGGAHKIGELLALLFVYVFEFFSKYFNIEIPFDLMNMVTLYIFIMESISIFENINKLSVDCFPKSIDEFFKKLRKGE